jgi:hypothetical protein
VTAAGVVFASPGPFAPRFAVRATIKENAHSETVTKVLESSYFKGIFRAPEGTTTHEDDSSSSSAFEDEHEDDNPPWEGQGRQALGCVADSKRRPTPFGSATAVALRSLPLCDHCRSAITAAAPATPIEREFLSSLSCR